MEITRTVSNGTLEITADGRLDGYWADHLDRALTEAVSDGHHRITLDCSKVTFLSSAGIGVLVKFRKRLAAIDGAFQVVNASKPVTLSLKMTRLTDLLNAPGRTEAIRVAREGPTRRLERDGAAFDVYDLDARASLTCRAIGSPAPLATGAFLDEHCVSLDSLQPAFAIGVGAFGDSAADCRTRFGELLSVAGATAYQPADGTNIPDYLVAAGALAADVRVLYCLACEGQFSHLIRFEMREHGTTIGLARLLASCLDAADTA